MKRMNCFKEHARLIYMGSVAALLFAGFLMEWLVKGCGSWQSFIAVFLPALPAVLVYVLESRHGLLDRTPCLLRNNHSFHAALPMALMCYGVILKDNVYSLNMYLSVCYLLCCYATYITLQDAPGIRCNLFLVQTALFGYLAVYWDIHAGSSVAISVLSIFLLPLMAAEEKDDSHSLPVAALAMVCMVICVVVPVMEKLLYTAVPQETAIVLDSFHNLLPNVRAFGKTALPYAEYEGLYSGHQLGYLLARLGWVASVPVGLAAAAMVISGFQTASNGRSVSVLCFGCQMLLVLRLISALLYLTGIAMGLCDDVPFLGGNMAQRAADYLLCAMVLLPAASVELEDLDPEDPDFSFRERKVLEELHHNRIGLTSLCRYVYDNPDALEGWLFLFDKYFDLMDSNTIYIMARNADSVLPPEIFRDNYLNMVPLDRGEEETQFDSEDAPDAEGNFCSRGVFLHRYLGFREKLVLPPFWMAIGAEAMVENPCLKAVSVPNTVLRICENAFRDCSALTCAELHEGLLMLDDYAFCNTGLTRIRLPKGLVSLGKGCFRNTALQSVEIPGTVHEIPQECFADNSCLETVVLEEGVSTIGANAFRNCSSLHVIHIPDSVRFVHPSAFTGCTALVHVETAEGWKVRNVDSLLPVLFPPNEKEVI